MIPLLKESVSYLMEFASDLNTYDGCGGSNGFRKWFHYRRKKLRGQGASLSCATCAICDDKGIGEY